jgi:hypothetical protein
MKTTRTILIIVLIIIILPFFGYFLWIIQKDHALDLMIVNKSVIDDKSNEVRSVNWVLNYNKIVKSSKNSYDYTRDYYGFYPEPLYETEYIRSFKLEDIPVVSDLYDGVYFVDNEGVKPEMVNDAIKTEYGGLNQNDYLLLKEMYEKGKLLIAEDNFFSEPTPDLVRFNTEQLLDVYSLHWKGKMFKNISLNKVQEKLGQQWIDAYEKYYNQTWRFDGPGLIIINEKQKRILVLPTDQYMMTEYPTISTDSDLAAFYNIPEDIDFDGWFQIVYEGKNQVISWLDLHLNEQGVNLFKKTGLESKFPIVIALSHDHQYFISGDFSKQNVMLGCSKSRVLSGSISGLCKIAGEKPGPFFHNYYVPFMSSVFQNYLKSKEYNKE